MRRALSVAFVLALGFGGGWYAREKRPAGSASGDRKVLYWVDPMHPWYKSDKPGIAPDCNMPLEPVYADGPAPAAEVQRKALYYRDPHDPKYRSEKPGINPETGNDLEPVYEEAGIVQIAPDRLQLVGVKYATVERASTQRTLRAVGRVAIDETKVVRVHPRVEGWIETVHVDHIGEAVTKGQPLLTIYSPELLASQQEYLLAIRGAQILKHSPVPDSDHQAYSLMEASRRRLELFDLSESQVQEVAKTGKPVRNVMLYAPANGYVMARNAFPKQKVTPDTELYQLADLSRVWIMADVFESDAASVRMGQKATVTVQGRRFTAEVTHILPSVDPQTRTLKVRLEAPNPGTQLKPEMYVDVDFAVGGDQRLTVPAAAVINTGLRQVVYLDLGSGRFQPRNVQVGESLGDRVVITGGLSAGDRVVTSGNFLIDSESQLRGGGNDQPHH
jgi:RND family efflux transporter MFP subunit